MKCYNENELPYSNREWGNGGSKGGVDQQQHLTSRGKMAVVIAPDNRALPYSEGSAGRGLHQ